MNYLNKGLKLDIFLIFIKIFYLISSVSMENITFEPLQGEWI